MESLSNSKNGLIRRYITSTCIVAAKTLARLDVCTCSYFVSCTSKLPQQVPAPLPANNSMNHSEKRAVQCGVHITAEPPNGFPKETSWLLKLFGPKFWALINNDGLTQCTSSIRRDGGQSSS